jgi:hypothetical protein
MKISTTSCRLLAGLAATAAVLGICLAAPGPAQAVIHSQRVMPNINSGLCLGSGYLNKPGSALGQYNCSYFTDQLWTSTLHSPGDFEIRDGFGLCLDIQGSTTTQNAPAVIQSCNGSTSQQWRMVLGSHQGGYFDSYLINVNSGLCLTIGNGSTSPGVPAVQATCQGADPSQQWQTQWFFAKFVDENSGQCMGVGGALTTAGAQVVQWPCNGSPDQTWKYDYATSQLEDGNSDMCLDVQGASTNYGAGIVQEPCQSALDQEWTYTSAGQFLNVNSGMCLGVPGATLQSGVQLVQWPCNGSPDQSWAEG